MQDAYTWLVEYDDGTVFPELQEDGSPRPFGEVDIPRVKQLWVRPSNGTPLPPYGVTLQDEQRPVFFRRRGLTLRSATGEQVPEPEITVVGWEDGNVASYLFVFRDGSAVLSSDRNAV